MADIARPPGRGDRWTHRARERLDASRADHRSVDVGFGVLRRDAEIGGGLLAGALAYRLFVLLLPSTLLLVSGLGLYAGSVDKSPGRLASEAGLHGLIASEVASTAASRSRGVVFILMLPAVLYALVVLYRAIVKIHAIAWYGSGHGVRITWRGVAVFAAALAADLVAIAIVGWIRRGDQLGGVAVLLVYVVMAGGSWLAVSIDLPHAAARWTQLLPGAVVVGVGLLLVNVFNVYITTRLVENRANTYGALGIATALLFSLVLVGRVIVISAEVNAALCDVPTPRG